MFITQLLCFQCDVLAADFKWVTMLVLWPALLAVWF